MTMIVAKIFVIVFFFGPSAFGYPPQRRLAPDEGSILKDAILQEDSVASTSEVTEEYEDSDDSDMYMEPETADNNQDNKNIEKLKHDTVEKVGTEATEKKDGVTNTSARSNLHKSQEVDNTKDYSHQNGRSNAEDESLETESQNFFPTFAELFANHRFPFAEQQRYRPNRFLGYFQRDRSGYQATAASTKDVQNPLLGSGNFGVIRGGTYYPEDKEADEYSADDSLYNHYYHNGNRGRVSHIRNPKPQPIRGGDFFANFRDFADITAPPKSSFSHLSVVYANRNGSVAGRITEPRNIIETLRMLEQEEQQVIPEGTTPTEIPRKKQSKGKMKLAKIKQYEEDKARRSGMTVEPLLALS